VLDADEPSYMISVVEKMLDGGWIFAANKSPQYGQTHHTSVCCHRLDGFV
jgi:hypothetical protein